MADRLFIKDKLEQWFEEVEPKAFYRAIFPEGELENHGERVDGKYNAIAVELLPKAFDGTRKTKRYTVTNELDLIDQLLMSDNFIIISPVSYAGRTRKSENARFLYAMAIDLDGITKESYLNDLFHQIIKVEHIPKPTYTVWSGTGLHLYYQFDKPIPCYRNIVKQLQGLKKDLTKRIWNMYVTSLSNKVQQESLFQGFRLVGGVTKSGSRTKAFITGDKVTIDYLNSFASEQNRVTEITQYKSNLSLEEARIKYPEWYERRIVNQEPKKTWTCKRDLYNWWKRKLLAEIKEGHRYYGVMVLAVYAKKCGINYEELEQDAFNLIEYLDSLTTEGNMAFSEEDVIAALEAYNDSYITFPINSITTLTDIPIQKNKRNYRKMPVHMAYMRGIKAVKQSLGENVTGTGRPSKKDDVLSWQLTHKDGTIKECIQDTGLSKSTVYKYWKGDKQ